MIIVDTHVIVAGLITNTPNANTARILDALVSGRIRPVISPALLDEYRAVLLRPKLVERHGLDSNEIDSLLSAIVQHAVWREPLSPIHPAPDPGDTYLGALLEIESSAVLITGDQRLLGAASYEKRAMQIRDYELSNH